MTAQIHIGDIGTIIELTIRDEAGEIVNLAGATELKVIINTPLGGALVKTGVLSTDGTDGKLRYVTVEDDLELAGKWHVQAAVTLPSGRWSSDVHEFWVYSNLRRA